MTKSTFLAVLFCAGTILSSIGIIGLLAGVSQAANAISAIIAAIGMAMAFGAEALNPKRPAR